VPSEVSVVNLKRGSFEGANAVEEGKKMDGGMGRGNRRGRVPVLTRTAHGAGVGVVASGVERAGREKLGGLWLQQGPIMRIRHHAKTTCFQLGRVMRIG
jgi:hypothetical protein